MQHHTASRRAPSSFRRRQLVSLSLLVVALALTALPTTTTARLTAHMATTKDDASNDNVNDNGEPPSCFTRDECCQLCGTDSARCKRGPCSDAFITKKFFSLSLPSTRTGFWDVVFAFYSMVPYLAFAALFLELLARRRMTWIRVFALCFIPIVSILTSSILVKALGKCSECARPCGSCLKSTGLPSGHATNASGYFVWIALECVRGFGRDWPWTRKVLVVLGVALLAGPIAYSRVYLGDHTELQVAIGTANGVLLGFLYFVLLHYICGKRLDRASEWCGTGRVRVQIANDYYTRKASPPRATDMTTSDSSNRPLVPPTQHQTTRDDAYASGPLTPPPRTTSAAQVV